MLEKENRMFEKFLKRLDPKDFQLKGMQSTPFQLLLSNVFICGGGKQFNLHIHLSWTCRRRESE